MYSNNCIVTISAVCLCFCCDNININCVKQSRENRRRKRDLDERYFMACLGPGCWGIMMGRRQERYVAYIVGI